MRIAHRNQITNWFDLFFCFVHVLLSTTAHGVALVLKRNGGGLSLPLGVASSRPFPSLGPQNGSALRESDRRTCCPLFSAVTRWPCGQPKKTTCLREERIANVNHQSKPAQGICIVLSLGCAYQRTRCSCCVSGEFVAAVGHPSQQHLFIIVFTVRKGGGLPCLFFLMCDFLHLILELGRRLIVIRSAGTLSFVPCANAGKCARFIFSLLVPHSLYFLHFHSSARGWSGWFCSFPVRERATIWRAIIMGAGDIET